MPTQVWLVHNPGAGLGSHEERQLIDSIERAGYAVRVLDPDSAPKWREQDLIAIAGGDGTVAQVVKRFHEGPQRFTVFPLGTANNIARALGINSAPALFGGSGGGAQRQLALARIRGGPAPVLFLESVGCGLLTGLLSRAGQSHPPRRSVRNQGDELNDHLRELCIRVDDVAPLPLTLQLDDERVSGSWLLVECLNLPTVGPGLPLAPNKDPGDGSLAVLLVEAAERGRLAEWLAALCEGEDVAPPFPLRQVRRVSFDCRPAELHVDDQGLRGHELCHFELEGGQRYVSVLT